MPKYPTITTGSIVSLREFMTVCEQQDVQLDEDCLEPVISRQPTTGKGHEPTPMFGVIAEAGRLLRKESDRSLASQPIRNLKPFNGDVAATTLANIINASIEPVSPAEDIFSFDCRDRLNINACPYAELGFAATYKDMRRMTQIDIFGGCEIILDKTDQPVFVRKAEGVASGLSLKPFVVNGIPYPAGSIARVELDTDYTDEDNHKVPVVCGGEIDVVSHEAITGVAFRRLSAFALPPGQRSAFGRSLEFGYGHRFQQDIKWTSINTINEAAIVAGAFVKRLELAEIYEEI